MFSAFTLLPVLTPRLRAGLSYPAVSGSHHLFTDSAKDAECGFNQFLFEWTSSLQFQLHTGEHTVFTESSPLLEGELMNRWTEALNTETFIHIILSILTPNTDHKLTATQISGGGWQIEGARAPPCLVESVFFIYFSFILWKKKKKTYLTTLYVYTSKT